MEVGKVKLLNVETEMQAAYLDYAMSVITSRALPDVRDGLKPVQRRILYAMHELGMRPGTQYKKSARIVGEVLGKYHPHGDSSVYESMVRMAQPFSLRYMLVDGQGNFGSVDGDPAAALRYTEARLFSIADEMLADIDADTVNFTPNFDGSLKEPSVLPARLPNLLVNGASGIAVGMATNIPPHNLGEVIDAINFIIDRLGKAADEGLPFEIVWSRALGLAVETKSLETAFKALPRPMTEEVREIIAKRPTETPASALLDLIEERTDVNPDDLLRYIKGPDFPTGGIIIGIQGIRSAYTTGHGRVVLRARARIEDIKGGRQALIVTELPYQVNKATLQERIAELVREKKLEGIADMRDESDREGMRLVIELKRDVPARGILSALFKFTSMQIGFSSNMVALVDGQPRVLTLKMAIFQYLSHRRTVVTRRTQHELARAKSRAHILEGLKIALDNLDAVIATIRASRDAETARNSLQRKFKLSELQAQAILDMQLRRLAALERDRIIKEYTEVMKQIAFLDDLLANPVKIVRIIQTELAEIRQKHADPRRTVILDEEAEEFSAADLIPESEVVIVVSRHDYVKRMPADSYRAKRGQYGAITASSREDDAIQNLLVAHAHDTILFFSNLGKVYAIKAHEVPESTRQGRGLPLVNLLKLGGLDGKRESVTAVLSIPDFSGNRSILLFTRAGNVKKLALIDLANTKANGLILMSIAKDDELAWARLTSGDDELIIVSENGQAIRFKEEEIRPSGRGSGGVRAIRLDDGVLVAGADIIEKDSQLIIVTSHGIAKRLSLNEFALQGRGGGGIRAASINEKSGPVAAARIVTTDDEVMIISAEGIVGQTPVTQIVKRNRTSQGQTAIDIWGEDSVVTMARLRPESDTSGPKASKSKIKAEKAEKTSARTLARIKAVRTASGANGASKEVSKDSAKDEDNSD